MFGLFRGKSYRQKVFFTFCPRFIFKLDPSRNLQKDHWGNQKAGDEHGYDKYEDLGDQHAAALFVEIESRLPKDGSILDLGCNCGYMLNKLSALGYKDLAGIDICGEAIEYGRKRFGLKGIHLNIGSYEDILPGFITGNRKFDLVYSGGASISLVHPSFDIVRHICAVSSKYVIMVDEDNLGLPYPRLWEYEFNKNGFTLVKFLRPADGGVYVHHKDHISSIAVYQRIRGI